MSTPTRLDAETALYSRWQGAMLWVYQRDDDPVTGQPPATNQAVTPTGSTAIYNDPLGYGLRLTGTVPANFADIADSDIAGAVPRWDMFLDLAEYRLGVSILASFTDVTESDFGRSASYDQYATRLQKRLDALMDQYKPFLTPFRVGASSGTIRWTPPTAHVPRWSPGYGGPAGRGRGGFGGWGC